MLSPVRITPMESQPDCKEHNGNTATRFVRQHVRYFILILTTLCLTSVISNMVTYNFTKICMENATADSSVIHHNRSEYSTTQKSMLQSFVAVGALTVQIPLTYAFQRFGDRPVFFAAGLVTATATALTPLANDLGFGFFLALRLLQGVAFATTFPVTGHVVNAWAPIAEHGLFVSLLTGCSMLGNIFTKPVSGALCSSSWGWPSVYYVHAGISFVLFTLWFICFRDYAQSLPAVTKQELACISRHRTASMSNDSNLRRSIPYRAILTTPVVWGCWIAAVGDLMAANLVAMFNPQFTKDVLGFTISKTGFLAALPIMAQFVSRMIAGISSDAITFLSETTKVRLYNSLALGVSAIFFVILAFIPRESRTLAIITLVITMGLIGCHAAGFSKCATLCSRQYSFFVVGHTTTIWSITILIEPFFVNAILHGENSAAVWRAVFIAHAVILLLSNLIFCLVANAEPARWTYVSDTNNTSTTAEIPSPMQSNQSENARGLYNK